jgi:hypothetical protein
VNARMMAFVDVGQRLPAWIIDLNYDGSQL